MKVWTYTLTPRGRLSLRGVNLPPPAARALLKAGYATRTRGRMMKLEAATRRRLRQARRLAG